MTHILSKPVTDIIPAKPVTDIIPAKPVTDIIPAEDWGLARYGGDLLCFVSGYWWKIVLHDGSFLRASQAGLKTYRGEPVGVNEWGVRMDPVMTFKTSEAAFQARDKAYRLYLRQHARRQK